MKWESVIDGHRTEIAEVGVDLLVAHCHTCDEHIGKYPKVFFPKYRLAMHAAWEDTDSHVKGLDYLVN